MRKQLSESEQQRLMSLIDEIGTLVGEPNLSTVLLQEFKGQSIPELVKGIQKMHIDGKYAISGIDMNEVSETVKQVLKEKYPDKFKNFN
jgi:hypothetical protein